MPTSSSGGLWENEYGTGETLGQITKTVLLVDDNDEVRRALGELVGMLFAPRVASGDLAVRTAASGEEAVTVCRQSRPSLVIMDLSMPGMDGIEAFRQIASEATGPIPTFLLTGYGSTGASEERIRSAMEAGLKGCLMKPIGAAELATLVRRWALDETV